MGYSNGQYWRQEQDEDMRILLTTPNNSKQWLAAWKRMYPRLRLMGVSILRRYFFVPDESVAQDLVTDAITKLVTVGKFNPDKPKLYAYCGTIMRRYFMDKLVIEPKQGNNNFIDKNYEIEDSYITDRYSVQPDDDFDLPERQRMLHDIMVIIDTGIKEQQGIVKYYTKRKRARLAVGYIANAKKEIEFLEDCREYFEINFMVGSVSAIAMADWIGAKNLFPDYRVQIYCYKYFKTGSNTEKIDNRKVVPENLHGNSYLMDDYCPNDNIKVKSRKWNMREKNGGKNIVSEYF